jgi:hypothetical protein
MGPANPKIPRSGRDPTNSTVVKTVGGFTNLEDINTCSPESLIKAQCSSAHILRTTRIMHSRTKANFPKVHFASPLTVVPVFLVLFLSLDMLMIECSAEPIVPRAGRSSVIRPTRVTYGDIEKMNKTCAGKDTCAPSRNGKKEVKLMSYEYNN